MTLQANLLAAAAPAHFAPTDALTTLLTIEGLVFAALGIAVALVLPADRVRSIPGGPRVLLAMINLLLIVTAVGAGFAWAEIYGPTFPRSIPARVVAVALILSIGAQPVVATVLSFGVRARR